MAVAGTKTERTRERLSRAIIETLHSWPELDRRVFVQSHYRGLSPEEISRSLGVSPGEVRQLLQRCDRSLRRALASFRGTDLESPVAGWAEAVGISS